MVLIAGALTSLVLACDAASSTSDPPGGAGGEAMSIDVLDDPERDAFAMPDEVVAALPLTPSMTVADIGAGSGYFSRRLAHRVPEGKVIAIDIDLEFKKHIEANRDAWGTPNIEPRLALDDNPVLKAGTVDLVFLSNTYPYIKDTESYFSIVHDALHDPGYVVIVGFRKGAACEGAPTCPEPRTRAPREKVIAEIEASGFALDSEESFLPYQYLLVFKRVPK
jgi:predicted methyltransferase